MKPGDIVRVKEEYRHYFVFGEDGPVRGLLLLLESHPFLGNKFLTSDGTVNVIDTIYLEVVTPNVITSS